MSIISFRLAREAEEARKKMQEPVEESKAPEPTAEVKPVEEVKPVAEAKPAAASVKPKAKTTAEK